MHYRNLEDTLVELSSKENVLVVDMFVMSTRPSTSGTSKCHITNSNFSPYSSYLLIFTMIDNSLSQLRELYESWEGKDEVGENFFWWIPNVC